MGAEEMELVSVFEAVDESDVELIRGFLEADGVSAMIEEHEPMLEGALSEEPGVWGEILVPGPMAARARELIELYKAGKPIEPESAEEGGQA